MLVINSFIQDQKHVSKSDKFQAIQPSMIAGVLADHGFELVHLKTGKARQADKAAHQTTIARYRSRDQFQIDGLGFDLIFKVPHLYGALQGVLGLFRGTCANQLNVGTHFESVKVRHTGTPIEDLNSLIPRLVAQREVLVETVKMMQAREVTPLELASLARTVSDVRLSGVENIASVQVSDLLKPRRTDDRLSDLFTVTNVIQENAMRHGIRYQTRQFSDAGIELVQNRTTRPVNEQGLSSIELNASIWDAATKILTA